MKLCPTCSGSPGKRMWLAVGMPHEDKPINVVMCEDPLHDAADRVGEIADVAELMLHAMALEELDESSVPMLRRFDELRDRLRSALPEVPR